MPDEAGEETPKRKRGRPRKGEERTTEYVVLKETGDRSYEEVSTLRAANADIAIKLALELAELSEGTYVATPLRSWNPITVRTEKVTRFVFGES